MFKKSIIAVAVLGAATFSAQAAFTLPHDNTTNTQAHAAAGWMVNENFAAVKKEVNTQAGKIEQNTKDIAANKGAIKSNSDRISNLGNLVSDVNIKAIEANMKGDSANNKADQNKKDIAANKEAIAANKDAIKSNSDRISNLGNLVSDVNIKAIEANMKGDSANNKADQNKKDIAKNAETIAKNYTEMKNNFAAMNSRIDDLDEEMKKGFASQAALAGLFQPYNVGKFNLSVALGGYESEQAMALGTGYRFNDNFAMKAGIATDVGGFDHLTYNIGANFEW